MEVLMMPAHHPGFDSRALQYRHSSYGPFHQPMQVSQASYSRHMLYQSDPTFPPPQTAPQSGITSCPVSVVTTDADEALRPSLPSISKLFGLADGDTPQQSSHSPRNDSVIDDQHIIAVQKAAQQNKLDAEYACKQNFVDLAVHQPSTLVVTPSKQERSLTMQMENPSTLSTHSSYSAPAYLMPSSTEDPMHFSQGQAQQQLLQQSLYSRTLPTSLNASEAYMTNNAYMMNESLASSPPVYSRLYANPTYNKTYLFSQRAIPTDLPATNMVGHEAVPTQFASQHHHFLSHNSLAGYANGQDRYVCKTCDKAFSRPSSLKIHTHSHTGEKPFKCLKPGCGKAFSVRSNMKRHERGCTAVHSHTIRLSP